MAKKDVASLSSTCSALRRIAVVHLFRELDIKHSWEASEALQMADVDPDIWIHVRKVTFRMAPFKDIASSTSRDWVYQRLRHTSNAWKLLLGCCKSLQSFVLDFKLRGLRKLDEPQAQMVWKSVSAIWDESQELGSAATTLTVMFNMDHTEPEDLDEWTPNTWSGLFEQFIGPERLTEVTFVHTDAGPLGGPSSLAHLPIDALKYLSLDVHPSRALALDGSANLTNLEFSLWRQTTPGTVFKILERFKRTLVTILLTSTPGEAEAFNSWRSATPCPPFDLPKLKKMTWKLASNLTIVASFFETARVPQHCKLDISAICDERKIGRTTAEAPDMEVVRLARVIERAGAQASVAVIYYPASSLSARIGHFAQLSRSFIGTRSKLHLTIPDCSYYEQDGVRPAIELLHGLVKQGVSQAVHKSCLRGCDSLPLDSYRSEEFPATLPFFNVREISLQMGKRYTKESALHLHFLLERLDLPGLETLCVDISGMDEHEGCFEALNAVQTYLPRWPALKAIQVWVRHEVKVGCGADEALRELQEMCQGRGIDLGLYRC